MVIWGKEATNREQIQQPAVPGASWRQDGSTKIG